MGDRPYKGLKEMRFWLESFVGYDRQIGLFTDILIASSYALIGQIISTI